MESAIKLPGSSFEEVTKIIQAYALANKVVSLDDISKRIGMHSTIISRNAGFLVSIGVLEGGRNKIVTPIGKRLGDAFSHELNDEVTSILHQIVEENEFLKNIVGAVRIRRGMDESSLRAHIAYSAGQARSQGVMTGTGAVVELLRRSGHLVEVDGKLTVASFTSSANESSTTHLPSSTPSTPPLAANRLVNTPLYSGGGSNNSIALNIEVRIDCRPDELDGLGAKLRAVVAEFEASTRSSTEAPEHD